MTYNNELQAIKAFIKKPVQNFPETSFSNKLKAFLFVFILSLACTMLLGAAIEWSAETFGFKDLIDSHKLQQAFSSIPLLLVGILVVVAIPLLEEIIFRLPLKYRRLTLNIVLPIILLGAAGMTGSAQIPAMAVAVVVIILFFVFNKRIHLRLEKAWQNRFGWVFYGFTFLFAIVHITNYEVTWLTVALFPLLLAPQFFAGFFIGYTRLRSGFAWGAAFHMLHNGLFVVPVLIVMANAFPPVNIQNNEYTLSISKSDKASLEPSYYSSPADSLVVKNYAFKGIMAILMDKEEKLVEIEDMFTADTSLDIAYGRKKAVTEAVTDKQNERLAKGYREDILNEMKEAYGLKLENEQKDMEYRQLYIKDSLKAKKHYVKMAGVQPSETYIGPNEVKLTEVSVKQLCEILGEQYENVYFDTALEKEYLFTLKFEKMPIGELEAYFDEHFGLGFKKSKKKVEITKVMFE